MKIITIITFLFYLNLSAQDINALNRQIGLNDILQTNELRIYKTEELIHYSSITRIYKDSTKTWKGENYQIYSRNRANNKKERLKIENNDSLWAAILTTKIQYLPSLKEVDYKLTSDNEVILFKGEYISFEERNTILDGIGYKVQIKTEKLENTIYYPNPEGYLKIYPNVDELIYFNTFLDLIKLKLKI